MGEAVGLILKGISLEYVKEINEEKYQQLVSVMPFLDQYNLFIRAKNLGIMFRPEDFTVDELYILSEIHEEIEKYHKGKTNGHR